MGGAHSLQSKHSKADNQRQPYLFNNTTLDTDFGATTSDTDFGATIAMASRHDDLVELLSGYFAISCFGNA